jgi:hypothetical protein
MMQEQIFLGSYLSIINILGADGKMIEKRERERHCSEA